jgi:hypothetical protein
MRFATMGPISDGDRAAFLTIELLATEIIPAASIIAKTVLLDQLGKPRPLHSEKDRRAGNVPVALGQGPGDALSLDLPLHVAQAFSSSRTLPGQS